MKGPKGDKNYRLSRRDVVIVLSSVVIGLVLFFTVGFLVAKYIYKPKIESQFNSKVDDLELIRLRRKKQNEGSFRGKKSTLKEQKKREKIKKKKKKKIKIEQKERHKKVSESKEKPEKIKKEPEKEIKTVKESKTTKESKSGEKYSIQIGAFKTKKQAEALLKKVGNIPFKISIIRVDLGTRGVWYRIRTSPFKSLEEARRAKELLKERYKLDTFIVND